MFNCPKIYTEHACDVYVELLSVFRWGKKYGRNRLACAGSS